MPDEPELRADLHVTAMGDQVDGTADVLRLRVVDATGATKLLMLDVDAAPAIMSALTEGLAQAFGERASTRPVPPPPPTSERAQSPVRTVSVSAARDGRAVALDFDTGAPPIRRLVLHPALAQALSERLADAMKRLRQLARRPTLPPPKPPRRH